MLLASSVTMLLAPCVTFNARRAFKSWVSPLFEHKNNGQMPIPNMPCVSFKETKNTARADSCKEATKT